jgi:hypothetical protein
MARFLKNWVANNQFGDTLRQNAVQFYQAVEMAVASWNDVSNKPLSNCFRDYSVRIFCRCNARGTKVYIIKFINCLY